MLLHVFYREGGGGGGKKGEWEGGREGGVMKAGVGREGEVRRGEGERVKDFALSHSSLRPVMGN